MNAQLQNDLYHFDSLLEAIKLQSLDFLRTIHQRPASIQPVRYGISSLEQKGLGGLETLKEFNEKFESLIVASSGPRYWGFVTGGATPASIMGDWLATVFDQNTQSVRGQGDLSAIIELDTIQMLLDLFGLPKDFTGGFVTGATMSNFTCLAVARQWLGRQAGMDPARDGLTKKMKILSGVPHSSIIKSLAMLGMGSNNIVKLKLMEGNREAIDINSLEQTIQSLEGQPFILATSAGTVNTVDYDDFNAIAKLKRKHEFWWHIDAAFGGFAACSPKFKHLVEGWDEADSITIDNHKWMNVPYENAFFLVKEKHSTLQMETFQNTNAPYLGDPKENFSYLNFLPENSRRLKALPVWFTLKAYGRQGYQDIVENSVNMAQLFGSYIQESTFFELMAPVRLNNICFTLRGDQDAGKINGFLSALNETGKVFMTPTIYNGKRGIRAAFVNWRTSQEDLEIVKREMEGVLLNDPELTVK